MVDRIADDIEDVSQIQNFYSGTSLLITGATGFLGKLILEKLLRTCTQIRTVFILIREKKGKPVEKRFQEIFDNVLFDRLRQEYPKFFDKIVLLTGDCVLPNLGLNDDATQRIIDEVDCIFHCAATVRFDEKIRTAVHINIRATKDLLSLSKKIKHLKAFIYVSTAFSYCNRKEIKEEFYQPPVTGDQLLNLVNNLSDELLESITPVLLGSWPNTYALTKAVAEEIIYSHSEDVPVAVVRPSIVIATVNEPVAGWIDNFYGATGVLVGVALGLIRTLHCKVDCRADMVPADFVINCAISAAWEVGTTSLYSKISKKELDLCKSKIGEGLNKENVFNGIHKNHDCTDMEQRVEETKIYNYVCSTQKPITWRVFMKYAEHHLKQLPSPLMVWHYCFILNSYNFMHLICVFLLHTIPAYSIEIFCKCIGKDFRLVKIYQKINKFLDVLAYFSTREWKFENNNTQTLWKKLNTKDRELFKFDLSTFDWDAYFYTYARGGRMYLLKDPLDTLPQGRVRYIKLQIAHYVVVSVLLALLFYIVSLILNKIL